MNPKVAHSPRSGHRSRIRFSVENITYGRETSPRGGTMGTMRIRLFGPAAHDSERRECAHHLLPASAPGRARMMSTGTLE